MLDPAMLTAIASAVVAALPALLQKAADKGAEEIGKSAVGAAIDRLKARLTHRGAGEALQELERQPADADAQGALRLQLRKAMADDPGLGEFLRQWADESRASAGGTTQVANVHGGSAVQIIGSGNSVSSG